MLIHRVIGTKLGFGIFTFLRTIGTKLGIRIFTFLRMIGAALGVGIFIFHYKEVTHSTLNHFSRKVLVL